MIFKKSYQIKPNTTGYLFTDHRFDKELPAGNYTFWGPKKRIEVFILPETSKLLTITNQEVLSKDNIALRFSFNVLYRIEDGKRFLSKFSLDNPVESIIYEAEQRLLNVIQVHIRNKIAGMDSEELNEKRGEIADFNMQAIEQTVAEFGITIEEITLKDMTFPKAIQELFAKHLEAKIRAKADLENARTAVATARALKNAAALLKEDGNIKFFQLLETINKIAEKGKHTFMIGDIDKLTSKE